MSHPPIAEPEPPEFAGQASDGLINAMIVMRQQMGAEGAAWDLTRPAWERLAKHLDAAGRELAAAGERLRSKQLKFFGLPLRLIPGPRVEVALCSADGLRRMEWALAQSHLIVSHDASRARVEIGIGGHEAQTAALTARVGDWPEAVRGQTVTLSIAGWDDSPFRDPSLWA